MELLWGLVRGLVIMAFRMREEYLRVRNRMADEGVQLIIISVVREYGDF